MTMTTMSSSGTVHERIDGIQVDGYHEQECIIDPATVKAIRYERIISSRSGSKSATVEG